jgi:hypothetical protein
MTTDANSESITTTIQFRRNMMVLTWRFRALPTLILPARELKATLFQYYISGPPVTDRYGRQRNWLVGHRTDPPGEDASETTSKSTYDMFRRHRWPALLASGVKPDQRYGILTTGTTTR